MVKFGFDDLIPFRYFFHILKTKWYWFLYSIILCLLIALLINRYSNEIYYNKIVINLDYNSLEKKIAREHAISK